METKKKLILVCDDEAEYRKLFSNRLTSEGFDICEAESGEEGLKIALKKKPDLILLDLNMPGIGGMGLLKGLRANAWGKDAKVIILTNLSDNEKIAEALTHGTFIYLIKSDMSVDELVSKIKGAL